MTPIGETTISELIENHGGSIKTGPFGTVLKAHEYTDEGVPLISVREIGVGRFNVDASTPKVSPEITDRLPEYLLEAGDLVFARKGAVDRSAMIDRAQSGWFLGSDGIRLRPPKGCNPRFIAYFFQSRRTQRWLLQHATGTTMPSLNNKIIEAVPINIPAKEEQDEIAEILSSLDEKIELNRKQNRTLEAIAQALFKRWFVEFEFPVENGQPYKSSGGAMQPSELGVIPVGWEVGSLGHFVVNKKECVNPSEISGATPYVGLEHIDRHTLGLSEWGFSKDVASNKSRFTEGNVLFGKLRPYFHKVAIAPHDGVCSTDILVIQVKSPVFYSFMVMLIFSTAFVDYSNNASTGTRMPRANWKHMEEYALAVPPENILKLFNQAIGSFFQKMRLNNVESKTLANLRDTLLPKLMSGELRIPNMMADHKTTTSEHYGATHAQ